MKLIVAVIRPEKLADVKRALFQVGVTGMTLSRVSGHGGERDVVQHYRGESVVLEFHERCGSKWPARRSMSSAPFRRSAKAPAREMSVTARSSSCRFRAHGPHSDGEHDNDALTAINADEVMRQTQLEMRVPKLEAL